jgi:prepilin peptidase CpaA
MDWYDLILGNWHVKLVCILLIVAAYIDGKQLRVPNWLTFPMVFAGLAYNTCVDGWGNADSGLVGAFYGMLVGLACLLPLYAVGGMGAGDVKLMAGIGAWLGMATTWHAFCVSAMVGAVMAIGMVLYKRRFMQHYANLLVILTEWMTIKNPKVLSELAAERKPTAMLLPYGIPICIGSIAYFSYANMI